MKEETKETITEGADMIQYLASLVLVAISVIGFMAIGNKEMTLLLGFIVGMYGLNLSIKKQ